MLLKINQSDRKIILRKLATKILPKEFDIKRKQGFSSKPEDVIYSMDYFNQKIIELRSKDFQSKKYFRTFK